MFKALAILFAVVNKAFSASSNPASITQTSRKPDRVLVLFIETSGQTNSRCYYVLLFYFLLGCATLNAQSGIVDRSFNKGDYTPYIPYSATAILHMPDGKIVAGIGDYVPYINRYDQYGTLDTTFRRGTGFNAYVHRLALQPDGKILAGGYFSSYNNQACDHLIRLNTDGTRDNRFHPWSGVNDNRTINTIVVLNDGKIMVGRGFCSSDTGIFRLNADGSLDTGFAAGEVFTANTFAHVSAIAIQQDGKIIIGGTFSTYNGTPANHILRLNTNGTIDNSFNVGTGFNLVNLAVKCLALQPDGNILAGGSFTTYKGDTQAYFMRLKPNGSMDTSFRPVLNSVVNDIVLQPDGKIIAGGVFDIGIARFNPDGSRDMTYETGTAFYIASNGLGGKDVYTLALQPDNSLLVGGEFSRFNGNVRINLLRVQPNGNLDSAFRIGGAAEDKINTIAFQKDSMILAGGAFRSYNGDNYSGIVRLFKDGSADSTFRPGFNNYVDKITVQPDGKILVGGGFTRCGNTNSSYLIRLNRNGTPDTTFNIGSGFLRYPNIYGYGVRAITIQPDGKILVGGMFTRFNGYNRNNLIRLNKDGSLDSTFHIGTGIDTLTSSFIYVNAINVQSDGKILVGGQFLSYNGIARNGLVRLFPDGSIDHDFSVSASERVFSHMLLPNGNILLSKWSDALQTGKLVRILPDGREDNSFNALPTTGLLILQALQHDGKILYSIYSKAGRLLKDGNADTTFYAGEAGSGSPTGGSHAYHGPAINTVVLQPDNRILVGGTFYTYNGMVRNHIVRLLNTDHPDTGSTSRPFQIYPNPTYGIIHIKFGEVPEGLYEINVLDILGRRLLSTSITVSSPLDEVSIDITPFASAPYILKFRHPKIKLGVKIIKL